MRKSVWKQGMLAATVAFNVLGAPAWAQAAEGDAIVKLRVLETTDLHVNMVNYDYFADKPTDEYGFAKTATLIRKAREEAKNSLLFDNGDLIQGNPLGDYVAKVDPLEEGETHPVYKAMNLFDYDAGNIGNHEFNFGLDFLQKSLAGSEFPYVNANVYVDDGDDDESNDKHYFTPYLILDREVVDESGATHTLKVGVIGFVPPQIMAWDKAHLEGKVVAKDIIDTAKALVPKMKAGGADIVIAIPHSGFETVPQSENMENATYYLSEVPDIDVILFGHSHRNFPDPAFEGVPGVDLEKGTINGVAAAMPGFWGNRLGVVDLELQLADGKWSVVETKVELRNIYDAATKTPLVEADQAVIEAVYEEHQDTIEYVRGPVGETTAPINSFFALLQDDPSIQIVNDAQTAYIAKALQGTEYEGLPVLSAGAPFKAGGRQGPTYYTNIPAGSLAIKNVADLYLYSNTVHAVLLTGAEVKEWLEWSAGQFNTIDPKSAAPQPLVNAAFPTYNFDVIDGVTYEIDVTKPPRYDASGKEIINPDSNRIVNLQYNGKPIDPEQKFVVATNNYRASSSALANPGGDRIIVKAPDENRQAVIDYIRDNGTINPSADGNWKLANTLGRANVTFLTSPDAAAFAASMDTLEYVGATADGYAEYRIVQSSTGDTAPSAPKPETVEPAQQSIYIVKPGDNLSKIAKLYGVTWQQLAKHNKLKNPNLIYPNQRIAIPSK
ncbi:bifunctional 2',3'-cyclic-nucleotide 2'-phosphodiesterase/3'-nucleotidase [Paenibacillus sp.]|uniref:bifunctional 2',3'-cyclic-nucleotide 2'-phosphodiesterase/3'-nucleotidase n=1 Tax=Paenibacillus sp. TaxID=58172 RepID=UPI002D737FCD|nr:bifunctional 2',3'-cyclic-nucleotide 2'-phosphodiesterase/3'-nucleotidase [Paenibacillus sp.]HZG85078.1 bifunctional 2',3'-cyclic-nucleotide 2'-phosphodiesterase/3'-nucleotidase [Paenibacillus sp.]